jgi:hypothetical protein
MSERKQSTLEEGLARGYGYAETHRDDRPNLRRIVRARSASDVTAHVDPAEVAADGIANPVAFWSGFAHGVRRYLVDDAVGPSRRS